MEIRKAVLTGSLELDDGTHVQVPEVTADTASRGRVMLHFGMPPVLLGRTVAGARARNEDTGVEFARRFPPPYLTVPPGDSLSVSFELGDCLQPERLLRLAGGGLDLS